MFLSTHFYYCRNAQKEKNKVFGFVLFDTVEDKEAAHKVLVSPAIATTEAAEAARKQADCW